MRRVTRMASVALRLIASIPVGVCIGLVAGFCLGKEVVLEMWKSA